MSLSERLVALVAAIAEELKARVTASHPGLARAWVRFGAAHGRITLRAAYLMGGVQRLSRGRYLLQFAAPMPDEHYVWTAHALGPAGEPLRLATGALKTRTHVELVCTDADGFATEARELNFVVYR